MTLCETSFDVGSTICAKGNVSDWFNIRRPFPYETALHIALRPSVRPSVLSGLVTQGRSEFGSQWRSSSILHYLVKTVRCSY